MEIFNIFYSDNLKRLLASTEISYKWIEKLTDLIQKLKMENEENKIFRIEQFNRILLNISLKKFSQLPIPLLQKRLLVKAPFPDASFKKQFEVYIYLFLSYIVQRI